MISIAKVDEECVGRRRRHRGRSVGRLRGSVRTCLGAGVVVLAVVATTGCGRAEFVSYVPAADLVPPLGDASGVHLGTVNWPLLYADCDAQELKDLASPDPNRTEWRAVTQVYVEPQPRSRIVSFATERFGSAGELDDRMEVIRGWFSEPCGDEEFPSVVAMEPADLDGLPEGAVTAHWPGASGDAWSTVIGDRDRKIMMIVVWDEDPADVPTDTFVEVVNTAWSTFREDNSR